MRPRVVLLNPPGSQPYLRDGYCSLVGRRTYRFHPMDLLIQSGLLRDRAQVTVVEAIGADLPVAEALRRVQAAQPELILSLVGSASLSEDAAFLAQVKSSCPASVLLGSGDVTQFEADGLEQLPALDGALLDFTAPDLLEALNGGGARVQWRGQPLATRPPHGGRFSYGIPQYDAFPEQNYCLPYHPGRPGSPLTSFGCPFPCRFCNTGQVSWKVREPEDLLAELRWLGAHGRRHVYIRDATFGVDRDHRQQVLSLLTTLEHPLTWNTFTRLDLFDEADLPLLHRAGCRVLQLGLETPDPELLRTLHKPLPPARARAFVAAAHRAGIAICGHFMIGLPGTEDPELQVRQTVDYALELGCDWANFNVAAPRPGAPFRSAGGFLSQSHGEALRGRAMRQFYTHPKILATQVRRMAQPRQALHVMRQAITLLAESATPDPAH